MKKSFGSKALGAKRIARQQWRARIETTINGMIELNNAGIARQQWRARIETNNGAACRSSSRWIARQQWRARIETMSASNTPNWNPQGSPASNGGRGLKHRERGLAAAARQDRPPAMAGAD